MSLSNARKAELRWEVIDAAFCHIEALLEQGEFNSEEEVKYMREAVRRAARQLNVRNHIDL